MVDRTDLAFSYADAWAYLNKLEHLGSTALKYLRRLQGRSPRTS